ncbi:protein NO VEIN domain-containing protein [Winogradskyella undariae]|uniref:protein NO VEIN domain-containing protein n=1 Tax=Winogradskyella undariae TaxID=1285465 RepID=UPI0015CD6031|nr:DUF3883 domain-containing protein [Winogradskyella undariae]
MDINEELIDRVFKNHHNFHNNIGVDFVKSDSGHVSQVSSDYQGRVLYELLQNAFDRAENKIIVKVIGDSLFVANDGKRFTYNTEHDYINGGKEGDVFERCDFQSLCSISTSNKTASQSIGNKGVGFKSVYALGRYANIHTKGLINPIADKKKANISFRLYDIFDDVDNVPVEFNATLKKDLTKTIEAIQREFTKRGVPGYYFPLQLSPENNSIFDSFDKEIVTIVEVPFKSKDEVDNLFEEIKNIHFDFVGLKYSNKFEIKFESDNNTFNKSIYTDDNTLFSSELNNEKIQKLAEVAGIEITEVKVAIKFKNEPTGLFYNYLPTKKQTPLRYVDFHADFHTTVDRKDINFDGDKVGAYNRALLDACVELYFTVLKSYIDNSQAISLNTEFIIENELKLKYFNWDYLMLNDVSKIYTKTRSIFNVHDYIDQYNIGNNRHYKNLVDVISGIAKKYFDTERETEIHQLFFNIILRFIKSFTNDYNTKYSRENEFKKELFGKIKLINAKVVPNINLSETDEVFYRKSEVKDELPNGIPIKITNFEIVDSSIRKTLSIKEYTQPNEILKHFKQCTYLGEVSEVSISEEEQKNILKSCYKLSPLKDKSNYLSSHRYTTIFNKRFRDSSSTSNQANFNVSTLFLKLKNGKYKPAQICSKFELDLSFLDFVKSSDIDNWLCYIGVSLVSKYCYVDINIYDKLKDGLDRLPQLLLRKETQDRIVGNLLNFVHVLTIPDKLTHPSIINDNNYSFLKSIRNPNIKLELDNLLVKKYDVFPTEYVNVLKEQLSNHFITSKKSVIPFYQNIFKICSKEGLYLVVVNSELSWVKNYDFHILTNKSDFNLCRIQFPEKPILAYYLGDISGVLERKIIKPKKGEIIFKERTLYSDFKELLAVRIPYILISLSHSKNSETNFLSEDTSLSRLQNSFEDMSIYDCRELSQQLDFGELGTDVSNKAYAYSKNELFISATSTKSERTQGICDFLFGNISVRDQVELILFHKELDELKNETDTVELEIINKKWKPDYQEKFNDFQNNILIHYSLNLDDNEEWFRYNKRNQNEFLIKCDKEDGLITLEKIISQAKDDFEDYFNDFQLEIDYSHIDSSIIALEEYFNNNEIEIEIELKKTIQFLIEKGKKKMLGIENEIDNLKNKFPEIFKIKKSETELKVKKDELHSIQDIEAIYKKLSSGKIKNVELNKLDVTNQTNTQLTINSKQIIYQGNSDNSENNKELEITGASGEVEVLICLINEFTQLSLEERKKGIEAIKVELQQRTNNGSFNKDADTSLEVVEDIEKLSKSLIPLFFISKKYKYANFDLITYRNGNPILVEVKTTKNDKTKHFYISKSEVNLAMTQPFYEIVRVTPQSIIFMGNPFKVIGKNILEVKTNGFTLTPRNYQLILN